MSIFPVQLTTTSRIGFCLIRLIYIHTRSCYMMCDHTWSALRTKYFIIYKAALVDCYSFRNLNVLPLQLETYYGDHKYLINQPATYLSLVTNPASGLKDNNRLRRMMLLPVKYPSEGGPKGDATGHIFLAFFTRSVFMSIFPLFYFLRNKYHRLYFIFPFSLLKKPRAGLTTIK